MFYMKKLGEILSLLVLMGLTASSAVADPTARPFEYEPRQVVYVQEKTFEQLYGNSGPLASIAMEYDYQLKLEEQKQQTLERQTALTIAQEQAEADLFEQYQLESDAAIAALWPHVGTTPYGFGKTPDRWDCSGLTLWYLEQRGITDVPHSATAQVRDIRSKIVDAPIAGDLVAFQKYGSKSYFHIGVYVGGGYMIHAANSRTDTVFQSVESFADSENSRVVFIRY